MKSVMITDYNTVIIDGEEETAKKYLNKLEKDIKKKKVTNFNYSASLEKISYTKKDDTYTIDVSNINGNNLKQLLSLQELENKVESSTLKEANDKELIESAKKGKIESEYTKQVYLEYLKKQLSIRKIFKNLTTKEFMSNNTSEVIENFDCIVTILSIISFVLFLILSVCKIVSPFPGFILMGVSVIELIGSSLAAIEGKGTIVSLLLYLITYLITNIVGNIFLNCKNIIKNLFTGRKMIKHKIKALENYQPLNKELIDKEKKSDILTDYIERNINGISMIISFSSKLKEEDKCNFKNELEQKLKEYSEELKKDESMETKVKSAQKLLDYVTDLRKRITAKTDGEKVLIEAPKLEVSTQAAVRTRKK